MASNTASVKPLRLVTRAMLRGGQTILANFHVHWWELDLDCGHTVERSCRYQKADNPRRGWAALHHPPSLALLLDAPKRARCGDCSTKTKEASHA